MSLSFVAVKANFAFTEINLNDNNNNHFLKLLCLFGSLSSPLLVVHGESVKVSWYEFDLEEGNGYQLCSIFVRFYLDKLNQLYFLQDLECN